MITRTEKLSLTRQAKQLANGEVTKIWFTYTLERGNYLFEKIMRYSGKTPRYSDAHGTLNGQTVAEITL